MIVAIGAFDGFHRGHSTLLEQACQRGEEFGVPWGIVTFTWNGDCALAPRSRRSLFVPREQHLLETYMKIPNVCRVDFTSEIAGMLPGEFLDFISDSFGVTGIVVGEDFRFGHGRTGDPEFLMREGKARSWPVDVMPLLLTREGLPVSSTIVRKAISAGCFPDAAELLGYPFFCMGEVVRGNGRGRDLGFPTANLQIPDGKLEIPGGVCATLVFIEGYWHIGAANIGFNPTFSDVDSRRFEVNLLDYSGDIYGRDIAVFFLERLRSEIRFDDKEQLISRVRQDIADTFKIGKEALSADASLWSDLGAALTALK